MSEVVDWLVLGGKWIGLLLLATLVTLCVRAGLLNTVKKLRRSWVRLHTMIVPSAERADRREWAEHMLWEEYEEDRRQGYGPDLIAVRMTWTWLRGVPADVAWSLASLPVYRAPTWRVVILMFSTGQLIMVPVALPLTRVIDSLVQALFINIPLVLISVFAAAWLSTALAYWFWRDRTWTGLQTYLSPVTWIIGTLRLVRDATLGIKAVRQYRRN